MTEIDPTANDSSFDTTYNPKSYEKKWWCFWIKEKIFAARINPNKKPFTILMPPPNVTSQLHMGHGTCFTFMDLLIRWKRMCGFEACWLPGTDHAGIATQMMVEKDLLEKEGKRRQDFERDDFVKRCYEWKEKYGNLIYEQFEAIGFSADWDRKAFTMDPHLSHAVRKVFVDFFNDGLIYRGERLVNWDPVLKTALSDDELYNEEINGHLWYIRYPVEGSEESITVATTRPETMLGDVAVAVHPEDERYKHLRGKKLVLPLCQRTIPIVFDDYVKAEFGSGAVKITPAHDPNDFELGRRHAFPVINIMNDDASLNDFVPEKFRGLDRVTARKTVVRALKENGYLEKEQPYRHSVPHSDRSKAIIEPRLSKQWFVKTDRLAEAAANAAREGKLRFFPASWQKTYLYWLDNIKDWCISRQLWWGHRIPVWTCSDCQHVFASLSDPSGCLKCHSEKIIQDPDVLDTWFSSWLWPLSPFGWPDQKREDLQGFDYFYPTDVLITAPEIIFLWVARMVMAGLYFKGEVPFRDIYLSATVTDKQGRKFSKTLGNGIDPMQVIEKHGADAVRFTGVSMAPLGGRITMEVGDFENGARFINKIWNAARLLYTNLTSTDVLKPIAQCKLDLANQWLLHRFSETSEKVNQCFEEYRLNEGVDRIYHFIWDDFCDWGLECAKPALQSSQTETKSASLSVLVYVFEGCLRLLHPIVPFVTEELWQKFPQHPDWPREKSIAISGYPVKNSALNFADAADEWNHVIDLVAATRSARQNVGIAPKTRIKMHVATNDSLAQIFERAKVWIERLAHAELCETGVNVSTKEASICAVGPGFECFIPAEGLIDFEREKSRITTEVNRLKKVVSGIEAKLANKNFVDRAPPDVISQTTAQRDNLRHQILSLEKNLKSLQA